METVQDVFSSVAGQSMSPFYWGGELMETKIVSLLKSVMSLVALLLGWRINGNSKASIKIGTKASSRPFIGVAN